MSTEEVADEFVNFDFAIMAIFATYVFEVSTQIGVQREKLRASKYWSKDEKRLKDAFKQVRTASTYAVTACLLLIIVTAIGMSLPTRALDERMVWILEGLSLLFASIVFGRLSFQVPEWSGVYYKIWDSVQEEESRTIKEVKFKARWAYYRIFLRFYFFLMPFFQGANALVIPLSMIAGIGAGLFAEGGVYLARRKKKLKRPIVISFIILLVFFSAGLLSDGVYFVAKVWGIMDNPARYKWMLSVFLICIFVESMLHIIRWRVSKRKFMSERDAIAAHAASVHRPRTATSLIIERLNKSKSKEETNHTEIVSEETGHEQGDTSANENDPEQAAATVGEGEAIQPDDPEATTNVDDVGPASELGSQAHPETAADDGPQVDSIAAADESESVASTPEEEEVYVPSYRQIFCSYWTCCGCVRGNDRTKTEKAWSFLYWFGYFVLVGLCLYLVIVNLGATAQQEHAREKLPFVQEAIYDYMNEGPVCAFDNKGADSNITTFADKDAAHEAGFLVLHCGACAACSDWHNLQQEYATREYLAKESARCAKKSLFGGRQAVLDCLKLPPIDFQGKCAECWVDDILCTKGFCAMIFLQSVVINTAGVFAVGPDTITSAACEEAHCEADNPGDFVFCSGATRRRMNVTSTIDRPGSQRCGIVDVEWATLFPDAA